jgi:hypothetical protein
LPHLAAHRVSDRLLIKLCKRITGEEWGSIDDTHRKEQARKEEALQANKSKSTAQMLTELYKDADDDAKKKLEEAWEIGRAKREAA